MENKKQSPANVLIFVGDSNKIYNCLKEYHHEYLENGIDMLNLTGLSHKEQSYKLNDYARNNITAGWNILAYSEDNKDLNDMEFFNSDLTNRLVASSSMKKKIMFGDISRRLQNLSEFDIIHVNNFTDVKVEVENKTGYRIPIFFDTPFVFNPRRGEATLSSVYYQSTEYKSKSLKDFTTVLEVHGLKSSTEDELRYNFNLAIQPTDTVAIVNRQIIKFING